MTNLQTPTHELFWYWNSIPAQFKRYICQCPNDGTRQFVNKVGQRWLSCNKCDKAYPTTVKECSNCHVVYLDDFEYVNRSARLGYLNWKCYDCAPDPTERKLWKPIVINPNFDIFA